MVFARFWLKFLTLAGLLVALSSCHAIDYGPAPTPIQAAGPAGVVALYVTATPPQLPHGGGQAVLDIFAAGNQAGTVPAPGVPLTLTASSGELAGTEVTTDRFGHAVVVWQGTSTADIVVTSITGIRGRTSITVRP